MDAKHNIVDIEALLDAGQSVQFAPQGWSMYPLLSDGRDQVIVEPLCGRAVRRGDVALYRRDESILVLHRVWKTTPEGIWFVGDNQKTVEGPLRHEQVRGVMSAAVRKGKTITVNDPVYRFLSSIWLLSRPLRPAISKAVAKLKRF